MSVNPVLLQKILKENNAVLQEYSEDLKKWGEDMKRKDESLKSAKPENSTAGGKKVKTEEKNEKKVKKKLPEKPARRIGGTDYSAWDKFDVDAELEKLDDDNDEDSELTDEHNESMYDEAIVQKEKGNKFVKSQNWDEAIKCYTKAIECHSFDPIFYANRAFCYLKKNEFEKCEKDCALSLKLDPTYVKAYQRRAAARISLKQYEFAESDLIKVLELEPKNRESQSELLKLRQKMNKPEKVEQRPVSKFTMSRSKQSASNKLASPFTTKLEPSTSRLVDDSKDIPKWSVEDVIPVKPISKPPHLRSQKPLKRIEIIELDSSQSKTDNLGSGEPSRQNNEQVVAFGDHVIARQQTDNKTHDEIKLTEKLEEISDKCEAKYELEFKRKQAEKILKNDSHPSFDNNLKTENLKEDKNSSNTDKKTTSATSNTNFVPPKSSVQFNLTWKNITDMDHKYIYLKSIDPKILPKIFLDSLESNVFSNILEVLVKYFIANKDNVWDILESMTHVKRFSALAMFMSSQDKQNLWKLIDFIKESDNEHKDDVNILVQKYEL
nr:unnamed protein product [Callosobruchus analis]